MIPAWQNYATFKNDTFHNIENEDNTDLDLIYQSQTTLVKLDEDINNLSNQSFEYKSAIPYSSSFNFEDKYNSESQDKDYGNLLLSDNGKP